jgi:hypothetical protein
MQCSLTSRPVFAPGVRYGALVQYSKLILFGKLQIGQASMNRRKKGNQILKARAKKANAKLAPPSKTKYISKAERLKLAAEPSQDPAIASES